MLRTAVAPAALSRGAGGSDAPTAATAGSSGGTGTVPGGLAGGHAQEVVVLDVRNAYEWDAGHFVGAKRPLEASHSEHPEHCPGSA